MDFSGLLGTKSTWIGIGMILTGAVMMYRGDLDTGIQTILGGFVTIFVRDAILKLQKGK